MCDYAEVAGERRLAWLSASTRKLKRIKMRRATCPRKHNSPAGLQSFQQGPFVNSKGHGLIYLNGGSRCGGLGGFETLVISISFSLSPNAVLFKYSPSGKPIDQSYSYG